jgi:peptidoglycan/LPS O-acetylase OafA/YrhL
MTESKTTNLAYLDGWRGLAIIAVLISHFGIHLYRTWMGTLGVQLFFVLSGYLMANLLFIKEVALPSFFLRRLSRILPTIVVFVPAMAIYSYWRTGNFPPLGEFFATLTFIRTYFPSNSNILESNWFVGQLWSLNVEEHSYIFLATVALIARLVKRPSVTLVLLALSTFGVFAFVVYYPSHPPSGAAPWYARSECAALGLFAAATIRIFKKTCSIPSFGRLNYLVTVACVGIAILCHTTYQYRGLHYSLAPLLLAVGINFLDGAPDLLRRWLSIGILRWFGKCSFSLYLWQQPFYIAVIAYEIPNLLGLALGITVGAASFYLLEDPARKWINAEGWRSKPAEHAPETKKFGA